MSRRNKIYPYPILECGGDNFETELSLDSAAYYRSESTDSFIIEIELTLDNPDINSYIDKGMAEYFYEVDCPKTFLNRCYLSKYNKYRIEIPKDCVVGSVTISCKIVAVTEIKEYICKDFNQTYFRNRTFKIGNGDLLVEFPEYSFDSRIKRLEDSSLGDYIEFREADTFSIDLDEIIYISMPKKMLEDIKSPQSIYNKCPALQHSSFVCMALMKALSQLSKAPSSIWKNSITLQLKGDSKFSEGKDYIVDEEGEISTIPNIDEVAYKILDSPLERAIEETKKNSFTAPDRVS